MLQAQSISSHSVDSVLYISSQTMGSGFTIGMVRSSNCRVSDLTPAAILFLNDSAFQIHSRDYRHPDIFQGKRVLVVGNGNSGETAIQTTDGNT